MATVQHQLNGFLRKYSPDIAARARAILAVMRQRLPNAVEMVYDNYNALVFGFGPTERPSEAIFSVALYPAYIRLFFLQGAKLPDPAGRLEGNGRMVRSIVLSAAEDLDDPQIGALMDAALTRAKVPMRPSQQRKVIVKSISPKQRPRKPAKPRR